MTITGNDDTATGEGALFNNTNGSGNTATGKEALTSNISGFNNTAIGVHALTSSTASANTAVGAGALLTDTTGQNNTANGINALSHNTTGSSNIGVGVSAGINLTTGSNNIDIGNTGVAGETSKIRIGKSGTQTATYVAGIFGKTASSGIEVLIDSTGHLGTVQSSARCKEGIKPMAKASEALLALEPVTFRYKEDLDPEDIPQFGLIAEQVEKVNPALVIRDENGKVMTVRYEAVNAVLLNEFLKEHREVQEQKRKSQEQEAEIAQKKKQIEFLSAGLQKVNEQVALQTPSPRTVANDQ